MEYQSTSSWQKKNMINRKQFCLSTNCCQEFVNIYNNLA